MNKLLVLARNRKTYFIKRLIEEVGDARVSFADPWIDMLIPADVLLVRTFGSYRSDMDLDYIRRWQFGKVVNPLSALEVTRSKLTQGRVLKALGATILPTHHLDEVTESIEGGRFILKPQFGQGGRLIRVLTREELMAFDETDRDFVVQPYVAVKDEFRCFFIGYKTFTLKRRGGLAANFAAGGEAQLVAPIQELEDIVDRYRLQFGQVYGALDVLKIGDAYVPLEMNAVPGIEQLEAVTGQNIMRLLVQLL
jgi:glutathione synthase/RimK-type ligase-like ATP-grasp enzyme